MRALQDLPDEEATVEVHGLQHVLKNDSGELIISVDDLKLYGGHFIYVCGNNVPDKSPLLQLLAFLFPSNRAGDISILDRTFTWPYNRDEREATNKRGGEITNRKTTRLISTHMS